MTQTKPSGPTSAMIGAVHSSTLPSRLNELRLLKLAPSGSRTNVPTRGPVGSGTNAVRFQDSFGYARGGWGGGPAGGAGGLGADGGGFPVLLRIGGGGEGGGAGGGGVPAVVVHLPHLRVGRVEHEARRDHPQDLGREAAADRLVVAVRDRHVDA